MPPSLPRFVPIGEDTTRFVRLEDLIAAEMGTLFPGLTVESIHPFRVTRNADIDLDGNDAEDLLMAVESELRRRRFGRAVRLEVAANMPDDTLALLIDELDLEPGDVTRTHSWLGLGSLWSLARIERPDLRYEPWMAIVPRRLGGDIAPADMFAVIRAGDLLVHHPYDSFSATVERFIAEAADDPKVLAIKLTLYRTSGDGQIVESLIRAVGAGKQVAVLAPPHARAHCRRAPERHAWTRADRDEDERPRRPRSWPRPGALTHLSLRERRRASLRGRHGLVHRFRHLMQRNLDHRVEAVVDVVDPSLTAELDELVTLLLHPNGTIDVHRELQAMAKARSSG